MSATAQCVKPKSEAASWTTLFNEVESSQTSSTLFMKKLLALGISNILFWRGLLPEAAFGERKVGESMLRILRNEPGCPPALKIIQWIKACFEPVSKGWIRNVYLVIRDSRNITTLETYTFKFQHFPDSVETEVYKNNKKISGVEGNTLQMLTNISAIVKPLGAPPFPCMISLDLDFQRPSPTLEIPRDVSMHGFMGTDELDHTFDEKRVAVNLGDVNTVYHECKLQIRTTTSRLNINRESHTVGQQGQAAAAAAAEQPVEEEQPAQPSQQAESKKRSQATAVDEEVNDTSDAEPKTKLAKSETSDTYHGSDQSDEELGVNCPCDSTSDNLATLACHRCKERQHLICYGFPPYLGDCSEIDMELAELFLCFNCSPCLQEMHKFSNHKFKELCLTRMVIADIIDDDLEKIHNPILTENKVVRARLIKEKIIIKKKSDDKGWKVNKRAMDRADREYFDSLKTYTDWDKPLKNNASKKKPGKNKSKKRSTK